MDWIVVAQIVTAILIAELIMCIVHKVLSGAPADAS